MAKLRRDPVDTLWVSWGCARVSLGIEHVGDWG